MNQIALFYFVLQSDCIVIFCDTSQIALLYFVIQIRLHCYIVIFCNMSQIAMYFVMHICTNVLLSRTWPGCSKHL